MDYFDSLFSNLNTCTGTSTSSTYSTESLTKEKIDELIEKVRPEHAILLCNYVEENNMFEMENLLPDKYYCKKLLLVNSLFYYTKLKNILKNQCINIKVYE